jgi:hypothetical protein
MNRLNVELIPAEIVFRIGEDLARCLYLSKGRMNVARYDRCVVDEVQESPSVFRKDDLLLGTLDGGSEVVVVGFLKLLTSLEGSAMSAKPHWD